MSVLEVVDTDTKKWDYLKEFVPELDYHKVHSDYRFANNFVGHIQRAMVIYWAITEHERTGGIGLEPGCGQVISPFCVGTDYFSGAVHPVYGGSYQPNVRCMGEVLPFKDGAFDFIVSNHSLEHMKDTEKTLREWLRVLKWGGKIAIVMPDKRCPYYKDPSHVSECTPQEFLAVLQRLENIQIIEFNNLKNYFSFNAVIEKIENSKDRGEIMDKGALEEVNLRQNMETLWQDRAMWTRMMMVSIATNPGEVDNILKRLRKNQDDIGDALKPYLEKYLFCWDDIPGKDTELVEFLFKDFSVNWIKADNVKAGKDEMGNAIKLSSEKNILEIRLNDDRTKAILELDLGGKPYEFKFQAKAENGKLNIYRDNIESRNVLVTILKNNITMSKNLIKARISGDIGMALDAEEALKDNAVSIAGFLCGFNSNWSHKNLEPMLFGYIMSLNDEIVAYMSKNNDADKEASDKIQKHALNIADALVDGVVKYTSETAAKPQCGN